jgi:hypothetical protein
VVSHLPEADITNAAGSWVWDAYSPRRLMEFEAEVYGRACQAHDEAMTTSFERLGWSMPSSALAPFGVVLELRHNSSEHGFAPPGLTAVRVPMALMPTLAPSGLDAIWSRSGRAVITQTTEHRDADWQKYSTAVEVIRSWLATQRGDQTTALAWTSTGADDMSETRPASSVAARWLWDDLKGLGLGTGTFPQLR